MKKYNNSMDVSICFDDILLVPSSESSVKSRYAVDLTMQLGTIKNPKAILNLKLPIIASPMDTVCEWEMASKMSENGGLGIIHRFMTIESRIEQLNRFEGLKGVAISLLESQDKSSIFNLLDAGVRVFCIDTANGHASRAVDAVEILRDMVNDDIHIMCGNVATHRAYSSLMIAGADSVRVGIGGGSACTTRIVSGHGIPTLSSIYDCKERNVEFFKDEVTGIIADGGIKNTGDMVKSFAFGANAIMLGSLLSGYDESPGEVVYDSQNRPIKQFRGMASKEAQENWLGGVSVSEGVSTFVPYKGKVQDFLKSIMGGLGSGCSYSGVDKLSELYNIAQYVQVSTHSINESMPHAKNIHPL